MTAKQRELLAGLLIAALWSAAPLYPSFVSLMPIAPPGLSLLSAGLSTALLGGVVLAIGTLLGLLLTCEARANLLDPLPRAVWIYAGSGALIGLLGLAPTMGILYGLFVSSTGVGMVALLFWGRQPRFAATMRGAMLASSGVAASIALVLWLLRWPAGLYAVGNGRAIGCFVIPGELAGYLGMFLPYALGVALTSASRRERLFAGAIALIQALAMLASFSRAGLTGLALGLSLVVARAGRGWLVAYVIGVLSIGAVLHVYIPDVQHNPAEDTNRLAIWYAALRVITLFPFLGVGPGGFTRVYPLVRLPDGATTAFHAHSLILSTLAETGILGFAALAHVWWCFIAMVRKAYPQASAQGKTLALAVLAGFVGTWLQSTIDVVQILVLGLWIPFMGITLLALEPFPG